MAQAVRIIDVHVYPKAVYLDGVRVAHDELEGTYKDMYKPLQAEYNISFV